MLRKPSYSELEYEVKEIKDVLSIKATEVGRLKSSILSNISHEVRTPMNSIVGFSNLLRDSSFSNEQKDFFISEINRSSQELLQLIDNILLAAKFESESISARKENCNVAKILDDLFYHYSLLIKTDPNSRLRIKVEKPDDEKLRVFFTDGEKLKTIFNNLIENALKFTVNGYVEIGYTIKELSYICFYVKDTGIGISNNDIDKVNSKFTQSDNNGYRNRNGLGLGLTIADGLVKILGGKLTISSTLGKGSLFSFSLPLTP